MKTRCSPSTCAADRSTSSRAGLAWGVACAALVAALLPPGAHAQAALAEARTVLERAMADFRAGRVAESVTGFDRVAQLAPGSAPELWQRGIALYYVDRFRDCRAQFESHRLVNPADVENAAWHYLCVARGESPAAARASLLPVGQDPREPMAQIYQMFAGSLSPDAVLAAGRTSARARFYASLYVGLYLEAQGDAQGAAAHIRAAAADEFAAVAGYMHAVARVHLQVRNWSARPAPATRR